MFVPLLHQQVSIAADGYAWVALDCKNQKFFEAPRWAVVVGAVPSATKSAAALVSRAGCLENMRPLKNFVIPEQMIIRSSAMNPVIQEYTQLHATYREVCASLQCITTKLRSEHMPIEPAYLARILHQPTASWKIAQLTGAENSLTVDNKTEQLQEVVGEVLTAQAGQVYIIS